MPEITRPKRRIDRPATVAHQAEASATVEVAEPTPEKPKGRESDPVPHGGMYPLNAPGMPLPGPDFMEVARRLGDETTVVNVKVTDDDGTKRTVKALSTPDGEEAVDVLADLMRQALRVPGFPLNVAVKAGLRKNVTFVPGHIWGQHANDYENRGADARPVDGPHRADVMVIGKIPGKMEVRDGRNLVGESGRLLVECLRNLHVRGIANWYVTNLCKFQPPDGTTTIKAGWLKDCLPLLHQELRIVRPKYILCLGADASKALLGNKHSVSYMDGRVVEFTYPIGLTADDDTTHTALVMTVVHPAQVSRAPEMHRVLERGLARFNLLQQGIRFDREEADIDHRAIRTLEELEGLLAEIEHEIASGVKTDNWIAMDAEWHGEHPQNKGSYVRTIQFAWRPKHACSLIWSAAGGAPCFVDENGEDARDRAVAMMNEFLKTKRVTGHFFVADLEWLTHIGMHQALRSFEVQLYDRPYDSLPGRWKVQLAKLGYISGDTVPAYAMTHLTGGWDTGLAGHAIEETAQLGLEVLAMRYTTCPRYDIPLQEWKDAYCKEHGLKAKDLEGYGNCPDDIIIPYGCYDADCTLRLRMEQEPLIDRDYEGNCCREPFWEAMITCPVILEIHRNGIPVDKNRIDYLTVVFMEAKAAQEAKIQEWANWQEVKDANGNVIQKAFNIRSVMQVREFLYGEDLNGKKTNSGETIRLRPPGAKSLYLEPILDTSKPPKPWWEIREKGLEHEHTPGTGKTILGVLAADNPEQQEQVQMLRDYRFLDQVLKSVLRPPKTDKAGNVLYDDGEGGETAGLVAGPDAYSVGEARAAGIGNDNLGGMIFEAGLAAVICSDGRVRTHLYPTTETGRWRSARPNLQNLSKRRDPDYTRLLGGSKNAKGKWVGGNYKYKLRSILMAPPGHVLVEADFKSAELYCMAIMSGDETLLEHCTRNQLAEDDPSYYDIHSSIAVMAFNLQCSPTKKGLEEIGKIALRVAAKNVIFGVAYGRGAKAIALQCKEEGNPITVEQAQQIIDAVFALYPGLVQFFEACRARVADPRWMSNCFGRLRRFPYTDDFGMQGEFERQGMNYPIQSMVASAMDRGIAYLRDYRNRVLRDPKFFRILLQIHDAVLLAVPYANVERVVDECIPLNLTDRVEIWPSDLAGVPTGVGPYRLGTDIEVFEHWGEGLTPEFCETNRIPVRFAKH